jgi:predicted secreted protein
MSQALKRVCGSASIGLLIALALAMPAAPAAADVHSFEVSEYRKDFDVSRAQAEEVLETQAKAAEAGLVEHLETKLDEDFAGIWFKPESGEYVVATVSGTAAPAVSREMATAKLAEDYRTRVVQYSWEELEAAQDELDKKLGEFFEAGLVYTSLDPRTNTAVLHVAADASEEDRAALDQIAKEVGDEVELRIGTENRFKINSGACNPLPGIADCGTPFRGGVRIDYWQSPNNARCTAGFRAIGTNGKRYVITAGHCAIKDLNNPDTSDPLIHWQAWDEQTLPMVGQIKYLGALEQISPYPTYDWMKIDATGTEWDTWNTPQGWPSMVAYWQKDKVKPSVDEEYDMHWEARSITGQMVCHSGATTGSTCGQVVNTGVSIERETGTGHDLVKVSGTCQWGGDSGGPWFFANTAYGIHNGNNAPSPCEGNAFYQEITQATDALGVTVAPRIPRVTATATALNGNSGWVTVKGTVTVPGTTMNNKDLNVKLFKWENEKWVEKANLPTKVNNNAYEIQNWNGVGPGAWIAKAVFPAQGQYAEAASDDVKEGSFTVKDGYRLVPKHSGKCMDVANVNKENGALFHQWECANPQIFQNQVFTLVPQGGGYYQLVARHSGRCADVKEVSQSDGALLIQIGCVGASQANQLFKVQTAETVGGVDYVYLIAKHSNKCIDVGAASQANGASIMQWTCGGTAQQKWSFQSVDSAPVQTETFASVPSAAVLNGQPGYVTVEGNVKAGAYPLAGKYVNVNYQKEVSPGNWSTISTTHPTLNSAGYYQYAHWGVSVGNWRARTVFPGGQGSQPPLAESSSSYHYFTIKSGYRFVFRHSSKCLTLSANNPAAGTPLVQWACASNPNPNDGQVFTLVPMGNGYFNIKVNSSGRCVDVTEWSQSPGTWLRQYDCWGPNQFNQHWQVVPILGQSGWFAFQVKHSGMCADVYASSTANGANVVQWYCNWGGQQQWAFQSVN